MKQTTSGNRILKMSGNTLLKEVNIFNESKDF